jgi:hypothetical protein
LGWENRKKQCKTPGGFGEIPGLWKGLNYIGQIAKHLVDLVKSGTLEGFKLHRPDCANGLNTDSGL